MKYLTLFLWFFSFSVFAQKQEPFRRAPFRIDSLPKQGILLDKGWRWHAGDNPDFGKADFDDSKWDTLSPATPLFQLPQVAEAQIGWFRLKFTVDSSLLNKPYIIDFTPHGAVEIYLNGNLVRKMGIVSKNPNVEKTIFGDINPLNIVLTKTTNSIFIRYSLTKSNFYFLKQTTNSPCNLIFSRLDGYCNDIIENSLSSLRNTFGNSIILFLAFIHACFYYFYRYQKANLTFSIALFINSISYLGVLFRNTAPSVSEVHIWDFLLTYSSPFYYLILLAAVYQYFQQAINRTYWLIVALNVLALIVNISLSAGSNSPILERLGMFAAIMVLLNYLYVSKMALKNKQKKPYIFYGGLLTLLLTILLAVIGSLFTKKIYFIQNSSELFTNSWIYLIFTILSIGQKLIIPISISLTFVSDFAQTSFSLQRKLDEVKQLSEEKQQILATQNETLEQKITDRTAELQKAIDDQKITQNQLIQKEKLASLGELTAGIAHEIQNPLNFVNNFAEMSVDLAQELKGEIEKSPLTPDGGIIVKDKELILDLANDLIQNQQKINHHGKRASSIVKGMLEHSRTSTGERAMTDINKLADEYLRLSYHGLRAKDKTFNSDFKTDFDESIPQIKCVPQDIGRVLLNLINNAFYATNQKKHLQDKVARSLSGKASGSSFQPFVTVSTKNDGKFVEICVGDNGMGIPNLNRDKIFQPFFTTKPAGEGTGLGLSLTYDIITKGHGGSIEVESMEGEGTTFVVRLPV